MGLSVNNREFTLMDTVVYKKIGTSLYVRLGEDRKWRTVVWR